MELVSLIIMGLGLLALGAIYVVSRISRQDLPKKRDETVPLLRDSDGVEISSVLDDVPARDGKRPTANARNLADVMVDKTKPLDQSIVLPPQLVLFIAADKETGFTGEAVLNALEKAHLNFGEMNIFHRLIRDHQGETVSLFSIANGVKPWTLIPDELEQQTTPGLSLILNLPAPVANQLAVQDFLRTADQLATDLNGILKNEDQQPVTPQYRAELLALVA